MEFIFPFSGSITFSPFNHTLRWHKQTYIGLKIELPVFEGWQKDRRSATLKIMEEKLEKQKEQLHTEIDQKAKILINKMDIAQRNAGIKKNEMNLSRLLFNKIIRNYSNGLVSMKDVTNAELDLNIKEMQYLRAVHTFLQSQLDYEQLTEEAE